MHQTLSRLWDNPQPPTALLIGGGLLVQPVCQWLNTNGLRIPEDLSVIAFDDVSAAALQTPPLTVVKQPLIQGVKTALKRLWYELDHPLEPAIHNTMTPEIILRESCTPLPTTTESTSYTGRQ